MTAAGRPPLLKPVFPAQHREALFAAAREPLRALIREQADFPVPGVLFRDLTPVLADARALVAVGTALAGSFGSVDLMAGLESRGFLLATAAAMVAGTGVLAVRKPGKLPGAVLTEEFDLEYGSAALQIHPDDVPDGARVLVVDDVLATGGTAGAAVRLVQRAGGQVAGVCVAVELQALNGRAALAGIPVAAILTL